MIRLLHSVAFPRCGDPRWCLWIMGLGLFACTAGQGIARPVDIRQDAASPEVTETAVTEIPLLSVAPLDHVVYPPSRPSWVRTGRWQGASNAKAVSHENARPGSHPAAYVVTTPPCETRRQCDLALEVLTDAAIIAHIKSLVGPNRSPRDVNADSLLPFASDVPYESEREVIDHRVIAADYSGTLTKGGTPMYESAVVLVFDDSLNDEIRQAGQAAELGRRLSAAGVVAAIAVSFLVLVATLLHTNSRRSARRAETA